MYSNRFHKRETRESKHSDFEGGGLVLKLSMEPVGTDLFKKKPNPLDGQAKTRPSAKSVKASFKKAQKNSEIPTPENNAKRKSDATESGKNINRLLMTFLTFQKENQRRKFHVPATVRKKKNLTSNLQRKSHNLLERFGKKSEIKM